jgi:hypothetical protein
VAFQKQQDLETNRLIVFSTDRNSVLLLAGGTGFRLPSLEIPRWQRVAENLCAEVKSKWGCTAISLFAPDMSISGNGSSGNCYQVMECVIQGEQHACNTAWRLIRSLTRDSFQEEADYQALQRSLTEAGTRETDPESPFARRGWFSELRSWATDTIKPLGLHLGEGFCQFNASPSFSLIRLETNGPAVWFKAVGEPNQREFPITLKLSQLFPGYVAEILGIQPSWNGWLSREADGTNLSEAKEISKWIVVAEALARFQLESIPKIAPIAEAGAHDLSTDRLSTLVHPFLDVIAQLMEQQIKVPPPILSQPDLALLRIRIQDSLTLLEELGIPDGLGHLDLNPGNIIVSANGCVFLDWAEAFVGHPFFSFEYLLEHFRHALGRDGALESQLVASYVTGWQRALPGDVITEALALAPLLAVFSYAAGTNAWKDERRLRDPKVAGYLRSLARRMNREAIPLSDRRSACFIS